MTGGRRPPVVKVTCKPKGGQDRTDILLVWRNDDGRLSVSLPQGVELRVNGQVVTAGKEGTHYLDVYVNEAVQPNGRGAGGQRQTQQAPPADDGWGAQSFNDDDSGIPF